MDVEDVDENVAIPPTQTEVGPVTVPVSLSLYTVLFTVAVIDPQAFVTV